MATPQELITDALFEAGITGTGVTPSAEQNSRSLRSLNRMLAQWAIKRFLVYKEVTVSKVSTGAQSYTIGTGGDFNTPRPDKLSSAFVRILNGSNVDTAVNIISAREDYNKITLKSLGTWPTDLYYQPDYPTGLLYWWPIPQATIYELFVTTKLRLTGFATLTETISLPAEYEAALMYNLAIRMASSYRKPPNPATVALAKDSLNTIRMANTAIANLDMPEGLSREKAYNIYSDR